MNSLDKVIEQIWNRKLAFIGAFFVIFTLSYAALFVLDFLPESPSEESDLKELDATKDKENETMDEEQVDEISEDLSSEMEVESMITVGASESILPLTISIKKLDKSITVLNPESRTIADLDEALLDGVVRHPDSATLTQEGNVFILGHSSYLPSVFNKNFQAFNGIQNLEWGDIIEVSSEESVFEYRVEKVYRASAQDVTVPIAGSGYNLTLATCNSFGSVDDRYIVEASRIDVRNM